MSINIYEISIPVIIKNFKTFSSILEEGKKFCKEKQINETVLINTRLFPNMLPLKSQIQIATDIARKGFFRVFDEDCPTFDDTEENFTDLQERIKKNITILEKLDSKKLEELQNHKIQFEIGQTKFNFNNFKEYLFVWIFPNFYFHMTTTYNILRSKGVDLGKKNFLSF